MIEAIGEKPTEPTLKGDAIADAMATKKYQVELRSYNRRLAEYKTEMAERKAAGLPPKAQTQAEPEKPAPVVDRAAEEKKKAEKAEKAAKAAEEAAERRREHEEERKKNDPFLKKMEEERKAKADAKKKQQEAEAAKASELGEKRMLEQLEASEAAKKAAAARSLEDAAAKKAAEAAEKVAQEQENALDIAMRRMFFRGDPEGEEPKKATPPASKSSSSIITAATAGDKAALKKALDSGVDVQTVGQEGNSPLHCAVAKETAATVSAVKMLLEYGADPRAENDLGDTPLGVAKSKKHKKLLPLLEEAAAVLDAKEADERRKKAEAKAAAKAAGGASAEELPYRRNANVGWKPLKKEWDRIIALRRPMTEDLGGRKVALSFSNKTDDAAFAKGLSEALTAKGCETKLITKWPVTGWVDACVWAADEADFVLVLHSENYDAGHLAIAERFVVKESNVAHMVFELDRPDHPEYAATPEEAMRLLTSGVVLTQNERVDTNTAPCTLSPNAMVREDREAYAKITKVWTPKVQAQDAMKIDLEKLADEQLAESAALAKKRAAEAGAAE